MKNFDEIFSIAARRYGGKDKLERLLSTPLPKKKIRAIPDDRWLSAATKCVFQSGFNWQVVENKWDRFEEVFGGFDLRRQSMMSDEDVGRLLKTKGIIANGAKIKSVGDNARFFLRLSEAYGSLGTYFAGWSVKDYCKNIQALQAGGSRLGGKTGQIFLRRLGVDTMVFSPDVLKALKREKVVSKMPSSRKDFAALQSAIETWHGQSGRGLTQISQVLAFSTE